ncbi:MAG: c-type cytochrome [Minwuia sp.]|uniref:c-type cytochrome n=1 Tax=Minwuia sp. TaxID=2493630 RepID=UPI003A886F84
MRITAVLILIAVLAAVVGGIVLLERSDGAGSGLAHQVAVTVPELTPAAQRGAAVFSANCVTCHGQNAAGGPGGPPLVHKIYEPGHHGDGSFVLAVKQGVRQHHWEFGNMPPVPGVADADIAAIIAYIRELQRANGIN